MINKEEWFQALQKCLEGELPAPQVDIGDPSKINICGSPKFMDMLTKINSNEVLLALSSIYEKTVSAFMAPIEKEFMETYRYEPTTQVTLARMAQDIERQNTMNLRQCQPSFCKMLIKNIYERGDELNSMGIRFEYFGECTGPKFKEVRINVPASLHESTVDLVKENTRKLYLKLNEAQIKYGLVNGWQYPPEGKEDDGRFFTTPEGCAKALAEHINKGDALDCLAYLMYLNALVPDQEQRKALLRGVFGATGE